MAISSSNHLSIRGSLAVSFRECAWFTWKRVWPNIKPTSFGACRSTLVKNSGNSSDNHWPIGPFVSFIIPSCSVWAGTQQIPKIHQKFYGFLSINNVTHKAPATFSQSRKGFSVCSSYSSPSLNIVSPWRWRSVHPWKLSDGSPKSPQLKRNIIFHHLPSISIFGVPVVKFPGCSWSGRTGKIRKWKTNLWISMGLSHLETIHHPPSLPRATLVVKQKTKHNKITTQKSIPRQTHFNESLPLFSPFCSSARVR